MVNSAMQLMRVSAVRTYPKFLFERVKSTNPVVVDNILRPLKLKLESLANLQSPEWLYTTLSIYAVSRFTISVLTNVICFNVFS